MSTIIRGTIDHLPWMRRWFIAMGQEIPAIYPIIDNDEVDNFVASVVAHMRENPRFAVFMAMQRTRPVGFLVGEITWRPIGRPHAVGTCHWLYVEPEARGHGIARQLIDAGLAWGKEQGVTTAEWFSLAEHDHWTRRGYTPFLVRYVAPLEAVAKQGTVPPDEHPGNGAVTNGRGREL